MRNKKQFEYFLLKPLKGCLQTMVFNVNSSVLCTLVSENSF